jgi:hypothetical protein
MRTRCWLMAWDAVVQEERRHPRTSTWRNRLSTTPWYGYASDVGAGVVKLLLLPLPPPLFALRSRVKLAGLVLRGAQREIRLCEFLPQQRRRDGVRS